MSKETQENPEILKIKDFVKDGRIDDAVKIIALYLGDSTDENYIERLEDIIETMLSLHGGRTVLRFLIENLVIDIPSLLENLSKRDSVLRYSFLLLLKTICEQECDLFLPYSEDLLNSDDPNVREADLQLLIFMAGGEKAIEEERLVGAITERLLDEKDFVIEKAIQALIAIGKIKPLIVTKSITNITKEHPEDESLKESVDSILKSIVTVEKIEEIVEDEEAEESDETIAIEDEVAKELEKEETEIIDKKIELKKKELEIEKKKIELQKKEKEIEEKIIQEKEKSLKLKEEIIEREGESVEPKEEEDVVPKKKLKKQIKKEESAILDKELELKKKDLEIKKKKLELEEKEKEIEELEIKQKEETLKIKEELIEKEGALSQVEMELKQKEIEEREQKLVDEERKRVEEKLKDIEDAIEENEQEENE